MYCASYIYAKRCSSLEGPGKDSFVVTFQKWLEGSEWMGSTHSLVRVQ